MREIFNFKNKILRKGTFKISFLLLVFVLIICGVIIAQTNAQEMARAILQVSGTTEYMKTGGNSVMVHHNATLKSGDITLKSVKLTQNNNDSFTAIGNPVFIDKENSITGKTINAYLAPSYAEVIGNVRMVNRPDPNKKSGSNNLNKVTIITCDKLVYYYSEKRAVFSGNVKTVQEKRIVWSKQAVYEEETDMLYLTGGVRYHDLSGSEVRSAKGVETASISLRDEWANLIPKEGGYIEFVIVLEIED